MIGAAQWIMIASSVFVCCPNFVNICTCSYSRKHEPFGLPHLCSVKVSKFSVHGCFTFLVKYFWKYFILLITSLLNEIFFS